MDHTNKFTNAHWDPVEEPHASSHWPYYYLPLTNSPSDPLLVDQTASFKGGLELEHEDEAVAEEVEEELGAMKEMMFKIAAMQPVDVDPATIRKPRRRNVRISDDPQSVAARHRRERISEKIRILQRLVPGGTKMDTASMLDEAIRYVKFLKRQIRLLQAAPPADDWVVLTAKNAPTVSSYLFEGAEAHNHNFMAD